MIACLDAHFHSLIGLDKGFSFFRSDQRAVWGCGCRDVHFLKD